MHGLTTIGRQVEQQLDRKRGHIARLGAWWRGRAAGADARHPGVLVAGMGEQHELGCIAKRLASGHAEVVGCILVARGHGCQAVTPGILMTGKHLVCSQIKPLLIPRRCGGRDGLGCLPTQLHLVDVQLPPLLPGSGHAALQLLCGLPGGAHQAGLLTGRLPPGERTCALGVRARMAGSGPCSHWLGRLEGCLRERHQRPGRVDVVARADGLPQSCDAAASLGAHDR